jgi:hypothetical protein
MRITQSRALRVAAFVSCIAMYTGFAFSAPSSSLKGTWTPVGSDCTVTDGAIQLTPRTLVADEVACTFTSLPARDGEAAAGRCSNLGDEGTASVTLRRTGTRLTLAYDDGPAVIYRRCKAR